MNKENTEWSVSPVELLCILTLVDFVPQNDLKTVCGLNVLRPRERDHFRVISPKLQKTNLNIYLLILIYG